MNITVNRSTAYGEIQAPPSKSMAHRCIICSALSEGISSLSGVAFSQDILATLDCIRSLGADVKLCGQEGEPAADYSEEAVERLLKQDRRATLQITGNSRLSNRPTAEFPCRESGSTLRFFLPLAMQSQERAVFYGSERLLERPLGIYEEISRKQNIRFERKKGQISVQGTLSPGVYEVPGNISSQFITGLLFALPLLEDDSEIRILPPIESLSYIKMTVSAMEEFGIKVLWEQPERLVIPGKQKYHSRNMQVEGDYSNAAFLEALNVAGGKVKVTGLKEETLQGDAVYQKLYEQLKQTAPVIDISDCPDLGPILMVVAALRNGARFTGTRRLAIKESDRGRVMCKELAKAGVETVYEENEITVKKSALLPPREPFCGHNDHRIVMSLTVLLTVTGGSLTGAEAVAKSYPDFFTDIRKLGIEVKEDGTVSE